MADDIVTWVNKKSGPPAKTITTVDEAKAHADASEVAVLGCFDSEDSDAAKEFVKTANEIDDIPFAITTDSAVKSEYDVSGDAVVLFKKVRVPVFYFM